MTKRQNKPSYLRVIQSDQPEEVSYEPDSSPLPRQQSLFPLYVDQAVIGIPMSKVSESTFCSTISEFKPKYIFDLRVAPNFNIGNYSRRRAFELFAKVNSIYYDYTGRNNILDSRDAKLHPHIFSEFVKTIVTELNRKRCGPICILGRDRKEVEIYCNVLADHASNSSLAWEVIII